jgi:O-antigen/teichoic acid export membrane protein
MAHGRRLREAIRNLSVKALSLGLERACRLFVVVASAPVLGQTAFGRFVFASTVTGLLAFGTDLGLAVWTTRSLARRHGDGNQIVALGLALRGFAALPYALGVAAVAAFAVQGEARAAIVLLGVAALVNAFVDHLGAILRGRERFTDEARLNTWRAVLTAAAGLGALTTGRSLESLCGALAAASVASCGYGWFTLTRLYPLRKLRLRLDRSLLQTTLGQSLPIWVAGLLSMMYFKVDTVFLRFFVGDAELGAYGAAFKFFEGAMVVPAVVLAVTFPQLARSHHDPPAQRRLEGQVGAGLLGLGLLVGGACLFGGAQLVRIIFGPGFGRAVPSLRILALGLPLLYLNYGLTHFLVARDMQRATSWFALLMLVFNVALDVALIPRASGPGAAWATVLTELALTACCLAALAQVRGEAVTPPLRSVPAAPRTDQTVA